MSVQLMDDRKAGLVNAGRREKSERRETKSVGERLVWAKKRRKGQETSRDRVERLPIGPQRVCVDEGSFHQRKR
jgi:hypothetical protein